MNSLTEHPTVRRLRPDPSIGERAEPFLDQKAIQWACTQLGADDAGWVDLEHPDVSDQREEILALLPGARTLISFVVKTNPEAIRAPARSIGNVEFHHVGDHVNEVGRRIVAYLNDRGIRALNATMGFPMEADRWPDKMWTVSHKPVAVAAGLGRMGIHRNVIHPRFGSFILLGTVVTEARVTGEPRVLDFNPCLECKLCVAACPTGAISPDGRFNFSACYTHNYREFMGGFGDWVEQLADSRDRFDYRRRVSAPETVSMWQSLGFGPSYKAAYCVAVCPAGEEVISPFLRERPAFLNSVVRPLQEKAETVYVTQGSDAQAHVARRFPNKRTKIVSSGLRPRSIRGFLAGLSLTFQPGVAGTLEATYHFSFTGDETIDATIRINRGSLEVNEGHAGVPDLRVAADARTWLRFLAGEANLAWALLRGQVRLRGAISLLAKFGKCFPL
jgi:NAD-dependent dihydropyrimidine dehydrogenase PreA subunit